MTDFAQPLDGPPLSVIEPTALLLGYLDWYREALQRKLTGLSEDQLRTPLLPSAGSSTDPPVNEPSGRLVCRDHLVLEGHGLVLREWAVGDVEALIALYDTEEMDLRTPVASPFDATAANKYIRDAHARLVEQTSLQLAVTEDGSEPVGEILVSQVKDDAQVELAYAIAAAHQGRGLARRAVLLALEHVSAAGVARARLSIGADNTASQQVAQATGFRPTELPPFERHRKGRTLLLHVWKRAL